MRSESPVVLADAIGLSPPEGLRPSNGLRTFLWKYDYTPLNYVRFLDHCVDLAFLRRVGGGYIYVHPMLMEHFASLSGEDLHELAAEGTTC